MHLNSRLDVPVAANRRSVVGTHAKRETAAVCRERSANDLLASVAMLNANQRLRMETSAAMWAERADILQRIEDGLARRTAATAAKRAVIGDEPAAEPMRL
jgi:hypothetical protein